MAGVYTPSLMDGKKEHHALLNKFVGEHAHIAPREVGGRTTVKPGHILQISLP